MDNVIENVGRRSEDWSEEGAPPDIGSKSINGYERNVLFWNQGQGQFVDVGFLTGSNRVEDGRGVAISDFDRDGQLDLVIQNRDRAAVLLMGRGASGNWLEVQLEGTESNRDALGAVVVSHHGDRSQARQVSGGSGYLAQSSSVLHFGLGDAEKVERLEIRWPAGHTQVLENVDANQRLSIREERASP